MDVSDISYVLKRSRRARRVRIIVYSTGAVVVVAPTLMSEGRIVNFVRDMQSWIIRKKIKSKTPLSNANTSSIKTDHRDFIRHKKEALKILSERVIYLNQFYAFTYKKIIVKNQKTRWGSCSRKGTLSFNYRLAFMPDHIRDYVVIHELCHLRQFNHSRAFWDLVALKAPDYKKIRSEIRKLGIIL